MSRQGRTESRVNKWNKRLLRLAAAAFVVMLLGRIFQPSGESFSVAQDGEVCPETELKISGQESTAKTEAASKGQSVLEAYYRDTYAGV